MDFSVSAGVLLIGKRLEKTEKFLGSMGLTYEGGADYTVQLVDEFGDILGNGCLCGNVLKYIAVNDALQGEGASVKLVSELVSEAYRRGLKRLFLFTKPSNVALFKGMGFYPIVETADVAFMENSRSGLDRWLNSLDVGQGVRGAVVVNCNPFTLGHRHLIQTAAAEVDTLHIFVVSEDRSYFSFKDRYEMVTRGTADIKNTIIHPSGDYIISHATFPTYFIKETSRANTINAVLDLTLFGKRIAKHLGISRRFVGHEPYCEVTRNYNECMKAVLPSFGVEVTEIERIGGISASRVRKLISEGRLSALAELVPQSTLEYIKERL